MLVIHIAGIVAYCVFYTGIFKDHTFNFWLITILNVVLSIIFTITMIYLTKVMRQINNGESFVREKRSIQIQFIFFLIALSTRSIKYGIELYLDHLRDDHEFRTDVDQDFADQLIESLLYIPWNVLPITYVYYVHLSTFKAMKAK